jgi:hypothetical protein
MKRLGNGQKGRNDGSVSKGTRAGLVNVILVNRLLSAIKRSLARRKHQADIGAYIKGGRKPWSRGYNLSKFDFITSVLNNSGLMAKFRAQQVLSDGYGYGYDERVVEYSRTLSRLSADSSKLLDVGSIFNFREIAGHLKVSGKHMRILTLVLESRAFW